MRSKIWKAVAGVAGALFVGFMAFAVFSNVYPDSIFLNQVAAALRVKPDTLNIWKGQGGLSSTLYRGSRGNSVRVVQDSLKVMYPELKYKPGYYDEATEGAVIKYQTDTKIPPTGVVDKATRTKLNTFLLEELCPKPDKNKKFEDYFLANVSPQVSVPSDYVAPDLMQIRKTVKTAGIICLRKDAEAHLATMFADAKKAGLTLYITSGFRRFEMQASILEATKAWKGDEAYKSVALPGHSEHQLGVAVDLSGKSVDYASTVYDFGTAPEGKWLAQNSYKYGFILSYPKDKESVTGYIYEPWHFRYVGVDLAKEIYDSGLTIREYLDKK